MLSAEQLKKFRDFAGKLCIAGRFDESIKSSQAALDMIDADADFPESGKPAWRAAFLSLIANACLAGKDAERAAEYFKKALEVQMGLPREASLAFTLDNLAKAQEYSGDILASLESRVAALEILEEFSPQSRLLIADRYLKVAEDYEALARPAEASGLRARAQRLSE